MISLRGLILSSLAITAVVSQSDPTCPETQQRAKGAPPSSTISQALQQVLSTPKNGPCSGVFPTLPNGSKSHRAHRSTGSLVLEVIKDDATAQIGHQSCVDAFTSIIHKCVEGGTYWGGNLTVNNVQYAIYNKASPENWTPASSAAQRQHSISSARHAVSSVPHPHMKPLSSPIAIVYDAVSSSRLSGFSTRTSLTTSPPPTNTNPPVTVRTALP